MGRRACRSSSPTSARRRSVWSSTAAAGSSTTRTPLRAYARILEICGDEAEYRRVRSEVGTAAVRSVAAMADDYDRLYRTTFAHPSSGADDAARPPVAGSDVQPCSSSAAPAGTIHRRRTSACSGGCTTRWHARRWRRTSSRSRTSWRGESTNPTSRIVQRNAVPPEAVDAFLERARRPRDPARRRHRRRPVCPGARRRELPRVPVAHRVAGAASSRQPTWSRRAPNSSGTRWRGGLAMSSSCPTSSTRRSGSVGARSLHRRSGRPHWSERLVRSARSRTAAWSRPAPRPRCNLVYVGSRTHADDLAMLRPVIEQLLEQSALRFRLFVIGGEPDATPEKIAGTSGCTCPQASRTTRRSSRGCGASVASWHIAVAPLRDTPFNRCKSDLKFLEYAGARASWGLQ